MCDTRPHDTGGSPTADVPSGITSPGEGEEDAADWGLADNHDEGVIFKQRILELTQRAHSDTHESPHALELCFSDSDDEEGVSQTGSSSSSCSSGGASVNAALDGSLLIEASQAGVNVAQHSRDFSTVCWEWQVRDEDGATVSPPVKARADRPVSASIVSTVSLTSSAESSKATSPRATRHEAATHSRGRTHNAALNTAPHSHASTPHSIAAVSAASASSAAVVTPAAVPTSSAASAAPISARARHSRGSGGPHRYNSPPHGSAGQGRNLSLDASARALGLNIVYLQRLALPLLRSEIHSFFSKLVARVDALTRQLLSDPCAVLRRMQAGMRHNAYRTDDVELKGNFRLSAEQLHAQILDIIRADPDVRDVDAALAHEAATDALQQQQHTNPSPYAPLFGFSSPLSPPYPSVSPPPPSSSPPPSLSSAAVPEWWPAPLLASHASLTRMRELFAMFMAGFDDAASTTGGGNATPSRRGSGGPLASPPPSGGHPHASPPRASAAARPPSHPTPTRPSALSVGSCVLSPTPRPSPSLSAMSSSFAPPRLLTALPTTRCNRDGLQVLARLMQSFSQLVAMEGGEMHHATRLALACQRMANTLLERHHVEQEEWAAHK